MTEPTTPLTMPTTPGYGPSLAELSLARLSQKPPYEDCGEGRATDTWRPGLDPPAWFEKELHDALSACLEAERAAIAAGMGYTSGSDLYELLDRWNERISDLELLVDDARLREGVWSSGEVTPDQAHATFDHYDYQYSLQTQAWNSMSSSLHAPATPAGPPERSPPGGWRDRSSPGGWRDRQPTSADENWE